ncbi:NADH-quinone oxidoreductase subunit C [Nocardioides iriomotensis]|uniref:NADH-quinone oxidoreductase subunit C n=1 Tax=Nocardioides iriomotensis TaxID=715784 RepID=A0A4Q5JA03_9ACTN|nr:NADH-quinone oxidoreductase subunit C [Nocardioides iriomotensis]RYU14858.1 NADH-quinone oxidoreductase subunit C [Nocardioides iriomotensis]
MSAGSELWPGRVRAAFAGAFGDAATVDEGFGPLSVDVPTEHWVDALRLARDGLDCAFFDFLTAVDELDEGFRVVCHVADHHAPGAGGVRHVLVRTLVPRDAATLPSVAAVYAGARWHERETHEMFGVDFTDDAGAVLALDKLLLPEQFEGHPLRKEFVLASRVAKPWPGAKEPGESDHDTGDTGRAAPATRRRVKPPGVPDDWRHAPSDGSDGDADE